MTNEYSSGKAVARTRIFGAIWEFIGAINRYAEQCAIQSATGVEESACSYQPPVNYTLSGLLLPVCGTNRDPHPVWLSSVLGQEGTMRAAFAG